MSKAAREAYNKLPELTPEEIHLAKCPVVVRNGKLLILDVRRERLILLADAYKKRE